MHLHRSPIAATLALLALGVASAGIRAAGPSGIARAQFVAQPAADADAPPPCGPSGGPACAVDLTDVALAAADEGWVVGDAGFVARLRAGRLEPAQSPTTARIEAVAIASPDEAWAVGRGIFRYANGAWSTVDGAGDDGAWLDVDLAGPDAGWAVGRDRGILRYDAGAWRPEALTDDLLPPDAAVVAVDAVAPGDAWAVSDAGTVLRYRDGAWAVDAVLDCQPGCRPSDIAMGAAEDGWVVGRATDGDVRRPLLYRRGPGGWAAASTDDLPALAADAGVTAVGIAGDEAV